MQKRQKLEYIICCDFHANRGYLRNAIISIVEFILGNLKTQKLFVPFLDTEMVHVLEILPHGRQGSIYPAQSIPWLRMTWRHKEPGHQQPWYCLSYTGIFSTWVKHTWVKSWSCGSLVTWFCYQLLAKPGNTTAAPSWPEPFYKMFTQSALYQHIEIYLSLPAYNKTWHHQWSLASRSPVPLWLVGPLPPASHALYVHGTGPKGKSLFSIYIGNLMQYCRISIALAMEILQYCPKQSISLYTHVFKS